MYKSVKMFKYINILSVLPLWINLSEGLLTYFPTFVIWVHMDAANICKAQSMINSSVFLWPGVSQKLQKPPLVVGNPWFKEINTQDKPLCVSTHLLESYGSSSSRRFLFYLSYDGLFFLNSLFSSYFLILVEA